MWLRDYGFVFWAYGPRDPVEALIRITRFLGRFGKEYMPIYMGNRVEALEEATVAEALAEWTSPDGLLATIIESANGLVLRMTVDLKKTQDLQFPNTLNLGFKTEHVSGPESLAFEQLRDLFVFCVEMFMPDYGRGAKIGEINESKEYEQKSRLIERRRVPTAVEWFNYFNTDMVKYLGGANRLFSEPVEEVRWIESLGGILLILQREPFDFKNPEHLARRHQVEAHLDLPHLQEIHRKPPSEQWWRS